MALSAPSNSIASRPTIKKGGVRSVDEDPGAFRARMDARYASNPAPAGAGQPGGVTPPTRRDNIVAARADGTFDPKRDKFNQANATTGRSMDEAGNITGTSTKLGGSLVPGRSAGSSVWQPTPPAPAAPAPAAPPPPPGASPAPAPAAPPTAATPPPAPAAAASNGGIPAPSGTVQPPPPTPAAPPKPASPAPAAPMARPPAVTPPKQASPPPAIAPPPPRPAVAAAAPAAAARKPGMINDGQGFKPASQVNAALRTAQSFPAAKAPAAAPQLVGPPPPPLVGPPVPAIGPAAQRLADFNKANPNVKTGPQIQAMRDDYKANRDKLAAIDAQKKKNASAPPPPRKLAGAGFTGPDGEAAAKEVVAQNRAEKDAEDLKRYKKEDAANPARNEQVQPSGKPYAFSSAGHGNKPAHQASVLDRPSTFRPSPGINPPPAKSIPRPSPGLLVGR